MSFVHFPYQSTNRLYLHSFRHYIDPHEPRRARKAFARRRGGWLLDGIGTAGDPLTGLCWGCPQFDAKQASHLVAACPVRHGGVAHGHRHQVLERTSFRNKRHPSSTQNAIQAETVRACKNAT